MSMKDDYLMYTNEISRCPVNVFASMLRPLSRSFSGRPWLAVHENFPILPWVYQPIHYASVLTFLNCCAVGTYFVLYLETDNNILHYAQFRLRLWATSAAFRSQQKHQLRAPIPDQTVCLAMTPFCRLLSRLEWKLISLRYEYLHWVLLQTMNRWYPFTKTSLYIYLEESDVHRE